MTEKYTLPEYPAISDMWEELRCESRPIVVYGMGNGADKLFDRLAMYGVAPADIFASDGFVRGHSFRGMRVKSFSEIKETYPDFVILLSFASNRPEVIEMLRELDGKYDMYVPDMPVADTTEYFDMHFFNEHYEEIVRAYESFGDEYSKNLFSLIIRYKLSGRMKFLLELCSTPYDIFRALPTEKIETYLDVGAYNGDTLKLAIDAFPKLRHAICIEPDPKTYKRLLKYADTITDLDLRCIMAAAGDSCGQGIIMSAGNRNSTVSATSSFEHRESETEVITLDSLGVRPDFIKYDVEGEEYNALIGSLATIREHHPALLVSLYHRSRDIFHLVNYLHSEYPDYTLTLKRARSLPAWEIDLLLT